MNKKILKELIEVMAQMMEEAAARDIDENSAVDNAELIKENKELKKHNDSLRGSNDNLYSLLAEKEEEIKNLKSKYIKLLKKQSNISDDYKNAECNGLIGMSATSSTACSNPIVIGKGTSTLHRNGTEDANARLKEKMNYGN